jgi:cell division protein FtsB
MKRADDHCPQSSTGAHCADNPLKSARIHPSLSSNQSKSQQSSDSTHFTEKAANVLRAPSQLLAPNGCCAFCDDAAEAADDLQKLILPPLQASVISVGRCIARNRWLSEQMQEKDENCQDLEDINVATVAENKELHEKLQDQNAEMSNLKHQNSDLCKKIASLVRSEQDLLEELKNLKSEVHDLSLELHTLRTGPKPPEKAPPVSSTGSSEKCSDSVDR